MKLSKRLAAILLLAVLLFALSGCSGTGANVFGITNPTTPLENAVLVDACEQVWRGHPNPLL